MKINESASDEARLRVVWLVTRAEAAVGVLEATTADWRWAMTAFSRYRLCELLDITPYGRYGGRLAEDPAALLDEAALVADQIVVPDDELCWHLSLVDALTTAAADIRMVRDHG